MGWAIGYDSNWNRDIGYSVPSICDHPRCNKVIDRGLAYVCGSNPYGGDHGCGLYFCEDHRAIYGRRNGNQIVHVSLCPACGHYRPTYKAKPDTIEWVRWKLTNRSWWQWRAENAAEVERLRKILKEQRTIKGSAGHLNYG
jgi:hypothetical protein